VVALSTTTCIGFAPMDKGIAADALPEATAVPLIVTVAMPLDVVGVRLTVLMPLATETA